MGSKNNNGGAGGGKSGDGSGNDGDNSEHDDMCVERVRGLGLILQRECLNATDLRSKGRMSVLSLCSDGDLFGGVEEPSFGNGGNAVTVGGAGAGDEKVLLNRISNLKILKNLEVLKPGVTQEITQAIRGSIAGEPDRMKDSGELERERNENSSSSGVGGINREDTDNSNTNSSGVLPLHSTSRDCTPVSGGDGNINNNINPAGMFSDYPQNAMSPATLESARRLSTSDCIPRGILKGVSETGSSHDGSTTARERFLQQTQSHQSHQSTYSRDTDNNFHTIRGNVAQAVSPVERKSVRISLTGLAEDSPLPALPGGASTPTPFLPDFERNSKESLGQRHDPSSLLVASATPRAPNGTPGSGNGAGSGKPGSSPVLGPLGYSSGMNSEGNSVGVVRTGTSVASNNIQSSQASSQSQCGQAQATTPIVVKGTACTGPNAGKMIEGSPPPLIGKTHSLMHVRQAITQDIETKAELYQTIFDSAFAAYSQMYELNIISELAYRALLESFEYAQESVHGELAAQYPFLQNFPDLHLEPFKTQTEASLEVFFDSLLYFLEHGIGLRWKLNLWVQKYVWRWFPCVSEQRVIGNRWSAMRRTFETVFSFIIVNETLIEELPLFDDFPHIRNTLTHLLHKAINEELYSLHCQSPEMFIMLEHLLAARLMLINKKNILHSLVREGVMKSTDVEHILETVIEPSFHRLTEWVPSVHLVEMMRAFCFGIGLNARNNMGNNGINFTRGGRLGRLGAFGLSKGNGRGVQYPVFRSAANICELRDMAGSGGGIGGGLGGGMNGGMGGGMMGGMGNAEGKWRHGCGGGPVVHPVVTQGRQTSPELNGAAVDDKGIALLEEGQGEEAVKRNTCLF